MWYLLLCVCLWVAGSEGLSTKEYEVKSGTYPYMAIVYYTDDTILEDGKRFIRNAILIRPSWLVSVSIEGNTTFPRKTLVARAGADSVDANFTSYEEDMEQDREIILVVTPSKDKLDWGYDNFLCLLKTIVPFNTTSMVVPTALPDTIKEYTGKSCFILVYVFPNNTEEEILMKWPVETLPRDSCKTNHSDLICSSYNTSASDIALCPRNRGGPLVCDDTVVGVQSYLDGCQQPHLHMALAWRGFIECGVQEQCQNESCLGVCTAYDKDPPVTISARRTNIVTMATMATIVTTTDLTDVETLSIPVDNNTALAVNESNYAFLKEEIKRTSDIAANLDNEIENATNAYTPGTNLTTNESTVTLTTPTRTADAILRVGDNDILVNFTKTPKKAIARTRSGASIPGIKDFIFILSTIFLIIIV